jgi:hypothetical protein
VQTVRYLAGVLRHWDPYYQVVPALVAQASIHHAVVFVPHSRNAPLGDHPFVPLEQADVVYFRTGPLPQWRIGTDWRTAYAEYFAGRSAYLLDGMTLRRLDTSALSAD